jgi:hypothetical protein
MAQVVEEPLPGGSVGMGGPCTGVLLGGQGPAVEAATRFHIALIDPDGHATYTCFATMISEAWRVAKANVYGRNLKRNA